MATTKLHKLTDGDPNRGPAGNTKVPVVPIPIRRRGRHSDGDKNVLLVVVTLIAAVTFQAGVNPPGGVWQQDDGNGHKAGRAIYADQPMAFYVFLISNTTALSTAILIIISLTYKFPFNMELWVAIMAMFTTYASAVFAILPDESIRKRYVLTAAAVPFGVQVLKKLYRRSRSPK